MSQQLARVAQYERDKEQQFAQAFRQAQAFVNQQRQKLANLEQYRLDYLKNIQQTGKAGVGAKHYHQHLSFVGKLDSACLQQNQHISQAVLAADQRKRQWLEQQRRCEAVETLLEKRRMEVARKEEKAEQDMLDEFATQAYYRRKNHAF
ncbi:flagellar export protein FliJ [Alteromonas halophila]|uniref:Flagellar FliJ protein n=1 Tax=Alteromonas halophila TaxID=516698 RepID=A0A918JC68_9ALTE|nr:flagellar export protein FliJ [Alteromonas halophila]GGW73640.1 flagellar export protein FliJ [Alteromonas halophila]